MALYKVVKPVDRRVVIIRQSFANRAVDQLLFLLGQSRRYRRSRLYVLLALEMRQPTIMQERRPFVSSLKIRWHRSKTRCKKAARGTYETCLRAAVYIVSRFTATCMHSDAAISVRVSLISRGDHLPRILTWGSSRCKGPDTEAWVRRDKEPCKRGGLRCDRLRSRTQR